MNPNIMGFIGPGLLNQVPTLVYIVELRSLVELKI